VKSRTREAKARDRRTPTLFDAAAPPVFHTADVARLLGVTPRRVRAMARAELCHPGRTTGRRYLFSFQDIVLLRAAHGLVGQRVPTRRVRQALRHLRRQLDPSRPLSAVRIFADGRQVVVRDGRSAWEPDTGQMMLLFDVADLARAAGVVVPVAARHAKEHHSRKRESADVLFERALQLEDRDPRAARETYRLALELDPHLSDAYINLGRLMHEEGQVKEATELYRRALKRVPDDPVALYNLALALEDQGDARGALTHYHRAIDADPAFADAHFNLGRLLERLGKRKQAVEHLLQYKRLTEE
jgi:tetratricopeptide (TPR) repeat protein